MNKNRIYLLVLGLLMSGVCNISFAQLRPPTIEPTDAEAIYSWKFYDNFSDGSPSGMLSSLQPKEQRTSSKSGTFIVDYGSNTPDSVRMAVNVATDIWSTMLSVEDTVWISVNYQPLLENDIETEVYYNTISSRDTISYPVSLFHCKISPIPIGKNHTGGIININSAKEWECGFSGEIIDGKRNLPYGVLRAISNVLGFGASTCVKKVRGSDIIVFGTHRGHSIFDRLIFNSEGVRLSDIPNKSNRLNQQLESFVNPSPSTIVYAGLEDIGYKMYAPQFYEKWKSLVYLDNPNSLMHYELTIGDKSLSVDTITMKLLKSIGWTISTPPSIKILSNEIGDNGLANANETYTFSLNNPINLMENSKWVYMLLKENSEWEIVKTESGCGTFTISPVSDISKYCRNVNGDLCGKIIFSGKLNGIEVSDIFRIYLGVKPLIKTVYITRREFYQNNMYNDVYFNVEYYGAESVTYDVEQEIISGIEGYYVEEPFLAHCVVNHLISPLTTWITVKAANQFGEDSYEIEIPRVVEDEMDYVVGGVEVNGYCEDVSQIEVYTIDGMRIIDYAVPSSCRILSDDKLDALPNGMYILRKTYSNGRIEITKYLKQ